MGLSLMQRAAGLAGPTIYPMQLSQHARGAVQQADADIHRGAVLQVMVNWAYPELTPVNGMPPISWS